MAAQRPLVSGLARAATAAEVLQGVDLAGRRAIVTGASSGIGLETARVLAAAGAEVTLAVRRADAGRDAAARIKGAHPGARLDVTTLDLADLASVRAFAGSWNGPLHILVNNAGIMAPPALRRSVDGFELQLATNHLGHFELARLLLPALASAAGARVVVVSSVGHRRADVDLDDLNFERRPYDPWIAYGQSKTASILFAVEAARRWAEDGLTVNALHPGGINTALDRHQGHAYHDRLEVQFGGADRVPWKTVEQGAATSVLLAGSPLVEGITGAYFEDLNESPVTGQPLAADGAHVSGVAPYAMDPGRARLLWNASASLTTTVTTA
jgi:NAD(P)-dependent dehydrogenase (short-subunit alcohol dehydrogenase family)